MYHTYILLDSKTINRKAIKLNIQQCNKELLNIKLFK